MFFGGEHTLQHSRFTPLQYTMFFGGERQICADDSLLCRLLIVMSTVCLASEILFSADIVIQWTSTIPNYMIYMLWAGVTAYGAFAGKSLRRSLDRLQYVASLEQRLQASCIRRCRVEY